MKNRDFFLLLAKGENKFASAPHGGFVLMRKNIFRSEEKPRSIGCDFPRQ